MKTFVILFTLFYFFNALAVAPYGIKGQQQSATLYSNVHQFPNNQVTNLGGINALVETGNKNILSNPSFEHSTFSTSWTNSAGTFTQELTTVIDGKASAKLVLSSQTMALTQSSTLYQAQFASGMVGIVSVIIKSDVALKVCSIQAGTVSTVNCQNVASSNTWGVYTVKFNLGATSNGISIASSGAVTGTVYIDSTYVGISPSSTEACSSTLSCTDTFSAKVSAAGVVSDENVSSFINGNCTVSSGLRTCTLGTSLVTNSMNCAVSIDANNGYATITTNTSSTLAVQTSNTATVSTAYPFEIICQKQGVDYIGKTINAVSSDQNMRIPGTTNYVTYMASLECDNASRILHQDGSWVSSIGNIAAGQCSVVLNASKFADANYRCSWGITISQSNGGTGQIATVRMLNASKTTTGFNLVGFFNSGGSTVANTDFTIDLICTGQAL